MKTMKAIRIHKYGDASVLTYEDAPRPETGERELLIKVAAAGVNPADWKLRAGHMKSMVPLMMPWIPGEDFSGVVEEVGGGVSDVRVGDNVYGKVDPPRDGSYAEYTVVARASV